MTSSPPNHFFIRIKFRGKKFLYEWGTVVFFHHPCSLFHTTAGCCLVQTLGIILLSSPLHEIQTHTHTHTHTHTQTDTHTHHTHIHTQNTYTNLLTFSITSSSDLLYIKHLVINIVQTTWATKSLQWQCRWCDWLVNSNIMGNDNTIVLVYQHVVFLHHPWG